MKTRTDIQKKLSLLGLARNAERGLQPQRNTFENRIGDQIGDSAALTCLALWFSLQNAVLLTFFVPAQNSLAYSWWKQDAKAEIRPNISRRSRSTVSAFQASQQFNLSWGNSRQGYIFSFFSEFSKLSQIREKFEKYDFSYKFKNSFDSVGKLQFL